MKHYLVTFRFKGQRKKQVLLFFKRLDAFVKIVELEEDNNVELNSIILEVFDL